MVENPMNKWMIWGYPYSWKHQFEGVNKNMYKKFFVFGLRKTCIQLLWLLLGTFFFFVWVAFWTFCLFQGLNRFNILQINKKVRCFCGNPWSSNLGSKVVSFLGKTQPLWGRICFHFSMQFGLLELPP